MCAHRAGGASTYRFVCALAQSIFFELPLNSLEATERTHTTPKQPARANASGLYGGGCVWFADVRATTKRGYGCASVAVRAEKRATKSDKIIVLFSETETAKQNQKISFPFLFPLRGGGVGGGGARKMQGNFLVFAHASPRACPRRASLVVRIQFKIHSNFVQYTPPKFGIRRNGQSGVAPKARH